MLADEEGVGPRGLLGNEGYRVRVLLDNLGRVARDRLLAVNRGCCIMNEWIRESN